MKLKFLGALSILAIGACGDLNQYGLSHPIISKPSYPVDAVKQISSDSNQADDPSSLLQVDYTISESSRLLLRREDLASRAQAFLIDADNRVTLSVTVVQTGDVARALTSLKLCPLNRNWMMLATWLRAHPFGKSGKWTTAGGDYTEALCLSPTVIAAAPTVLVFDVSAVVTDQVRGLGTNNGFVLELNAGASPISLAGDNALTGMPAMGWTEVVR